MGLREKIDRFKTKWGAGGLKRSLERKRARREARRNGRPAGGESVAGDDIANSLIPHNLLPVLYLSKGEKPFGRRLTLLIDGAGPKNLYGGVGTSLIVANEICRHHNAALRIVSLFEPAEPGRLRDTLEVYGANLPSACEFIFCPLSGNGRRIDVTPEDRFMTTSWWSTDAAIRTIPVGKIHYLIQEDERMFYPHGDDRLRSDAILQNPDIRLVVNSSLLHEHFLHDGVRNYEQRAQFFEPVFPSNAYFPRPASGKLKLMFYARPHHPRNLFGFGVQVLKEAISRSMLDAEQWEIYMVGHDMQGADILSGYPYKSVSGLKWGEYVDLVGQMDVGLSLMYTPHPSYPPLDMVASGAIVVTNRFGVKHDLARYSDSIICAELEMESMVEALGAAVATASARRHDGSSCRVRSYKINNSWQEALGHIVQMFRFE